MIIEFDVNNKKYLKCIVNKNVLTALSIEHITKQVYKVLKHWD